MAKPSKALRAIIDEGSRLYEPHGVKPGLPLKAAIVASSPYLAARVAKRKFDEGKHERDLRAGKIPEILDYTEMFITSYCSIDCKWCSASIPYYKKKYHIPVEFLNRQTERYLEAIDGVERFRVLGGEPFMHPDLAQVLRPLVESPKVQSVHIVTNGTIVPKKPEVLEILKSPKVYLDISNYGPVSCKVPELQELEKQGLMQLNIDTVTTWFVPNHNYEDKGFTREQAHNIYKTCPDFCHVLRDGKLFYCGEAFHIANIDDTPMRAGIDYVDLFDTTKTTRELHRDVNNLIMKRARRMNACERCVGSFVYKDRCLVAGEQLKPGESMPYELPADIENVSTKMI